MNHNTAPVEVREQLAFDMERLASLFDAFSREGAQETLIVTTCNRAEFYVAGRASQESACVTRRVLAQFVDERILNTPAYWYERRNADAIAHLFRVASGLDSLVLGEPEILGQVKQAFDAARHYGTLGVFFGEVFQRCTHVVKRVRTETAIGFGSISLASATVDVLRDELGDLQNRRLLLLGTGEIAQQVATYLAKAAPKELLIVSRSLDRAERLAGEYGARPSALDRLTSHLDDVDGVVCATTSPTPIIRPENLNITALAGRRQPFAIVDLAHPRNVEPEIRLLPNVRLFAIDDLRTVVDRNLGRRRAELPFAEAIIERETAQLAMWHRSRPLMEVVKTFRSQFEEVRQQELKRLRPHLSEAEYEAADEATRRVLAKLLHKPTLLLKSLNPDDPGDREKLALWSECFGVNADSIEY
jgi:glutamyl-tRNA reductase